MSTHLSSSLPPQDDEIPDDELLLDGDGEGDGDDDPLEAEALAEGYESAAQKAQMETEARRQGWRPLAEYRGAAGKWKSAKKFIEDGQNYIPFLQKDLREAREQNERISTEMEGLRTEVGQTRQQMQQLLDFSRKSSQAGYDRAIRDLKQQQREAASTGDVTTFDKIEEQISAMDEERAAASEPAAPAPRKEDPPKPEPKVTVDPAYGQWYSENPWFNRDRVLNAAMIEAHNGVLNESPGLGVYESLERAKEAVMVDFPKKFGLPDKGGNEPPAPAPPRRPAGALRPRGGNDGAPRRPATDDPIEAIEDARTRADARAGYAQAARSMPDLTKAEYMEIFTNPHADVLSIRRARKGK